MIYWRWCCLVIIYFHVTLSFLLIFILMHLPFMGSFTPDLNVTHTHIFLLWVCQTEIPFGLNWHNPVFANLRLPSVPHELTANWSIWKNKSQPTSDFNCRPHMWSWVGCETGPTNGLAVSEIGRKLSLTPDAMVVDSRDVELRLTKNWLLSGSMQIRFCWMDISSSSYTHPGIQDILSPIAYNIDHLKKLVWKAL